jgi:hypothetical protein
VLAERAFAPRAPAEFVAARTLLLFDTVAFVLDLGLQTVQQIPNRKAESLIAFR